MKANRSILTVSLALAFILSCSSDNKGDDENNPSSSSEMLVSSSSGQSSSSEYSGISSSSADTEASSSSKQQGQYSSSSGQAAVEPIGLGYFGNVGSLNATFWELMADPNSDIWTGASNQGTYRNMDLPNYNVSSTQGFKSFDIASPGSTPITFTKSGYRFIALPAELGYPSRVNDALGLDAKDVAFTVPPSNRTIKGQYYIVYEGDVSVVDGNMTLTIIY